VTCLDHRVDPAITLGLQLGDAVVIRNTGGRVTPAVIDDVPYLAFLARQLFSGIVAAEGLFEVAVVHHTPCGTNFLADPACPPPASGPAPPRRPACPRRRWKPPPSLTRTPPSAPTPSAC